MNAKQLVHTHTHMNAKQIVHDCNPMHSNPKHSNPKDAGRVGTLSDHALVHPYKHIHVYNFSLSVNRGKSF